jgi:hypothetical protein
MKFAFLITMTLLLAAPSVRANRLDQQPPPDEERDLPPDDDMRPPPRGPHGPPPGGPRGPGGPGGRFGPGQRRPPMDELLTPEFIKEAMEILQQKLPRLHARLTEVQQRSPERFKRMLARAMPPIREYMQLRKRRPDLADSIFREFEIQARLNELSREYRDTENDPARRAQMDAEIQKLVEEQITIHHNRMGARLEEFERRLKDQESQLKRQREMHEKAAAEMQTSIRWKVEDVKAGRVGPNPGGPPPGEGPEGGPPDRPWPGDRPPPRDGEPHDQPDDEQ